MANSKDPFRPGSICNQVLNLIYELGELPYSALRVLGSSTKSNQNTIKKMEEKGYFRIEKLYKGKTIKLGRRNNELSEYIFPGALEVYNSAVHNTYHVPETRKVNFSNITKQTRRDRNIRVGKSAAFFQGAGIYVYSDGSKNKPNLRKSFLTGNEIAYYLSSDIKNFMSDEEKRISARSLGCIVYFHDMYMVYFLDVTVPKTSQDVERKFRIHMEVAVNRGNHGKYALSINKCVLVLEQYGLLERIFHNDESDDSGKYKYQRMLFSIDDTYDEFFCLPYDRKGQEILKMLFHDRNRLKYLPIKKSEREFETTTVDCDGIDEDGNFILSFLDCEARKLKRFIEMANYFASNGSDCIFRIICFDFQVETIKKLCTENCEIYSYTVEQVVHAYGWSEGREE